MASFTVNSKNIHLLLVYFCWVKDMINIFMQTRPWLLWFLFPVLILNPIITLSSMLIIFYSKYIFSKLWSMRWDCKASPLRFSWILGGVNFILGFKFKVTLLDWLIVDQKDSSLFCLQYKVNKYCKQTVSAEIWTLIGDSIFYTEPLGCLHLPGDINKIKIMKLFNVESLA